jgi:type II secretion system protein I
MKKGDILLFRTAVILRRQVGQKVECPLFGFSLLEVVLALAILAGALAALGEVMRLGDQNAAAAADESQAQMFAESVMSELLVGARPVGNASGELPTEDDPPWVFEIEIQPTDFQELIAVRVSVSQQLAAQLEPARCDLVRWLPNPNFVPAIQQATEPASSGENSGPQQTGAPQ